MALYHLALVIAMLVSYAPAAEAQTTAQITIGVVFGATAPTAGLQRQQFAGAFRNGFGAAVGLAGCTGRVDPLMANGQVITYSTNGASASITFQYSITPASFYTAVALVVSDPAGWFSELDRSKQYTQQLIQFLDPSPPGGFATSSSVPFLTYPAGVLPYAPCTSTGGRKLLALERRRFAQLEHKSSPL